jgi:hypothetical protein
VGELRMHASGRVPYREFTADWQQNFQPADSAAATTSVPGPFPRVDQVECQTTGQNGMPWYHEALF